MDKRFVSLNVFQDSGSPSRVIPKHVRDNELRSGS